MYGFVADKSSRKNNTYAKPLSKLLLADANQRANPLV